MNRVDETELKKRLKSREGMFLRRRRNTSCSGALVTLRMKPCGAPIGPQPRSIIQTCYGHPGVRRRRSRRQPSRWRKSMPPGRKSERNETCESSREIHEVDPRLVRVSATLTELFQHLSIFAGFVNC